MVVLHIIYTLMALKICGRSNLRGQCTKLEKAGGTWMTGKMKHLDTWYAPGERHGKPWLSLVSTSYTVLEPSLQTSTAHILGDLLTSPDLVLQLVLLTCPESYLQGDSRLCVVDTKQTNKTVKQNSLRLELKNIFWISLLIFNSRSKSELTQGWKPKPLGDITLLHLKWLLQWRKKILGEAVKKKKFQWREKNCIASIEISVKSIKNL